MSQTEISQGDNDNQEVQRLDAKLSDGAQKTEFFFTAPCIFRVPSSVRKLKESAYSPSLIAIGPLHQNDEHLLQTPMKHVKLSYVNNLFCRLTEGETNLELAKKKKFTALENCMAAMKMSIEDVKKCYAEEVTLDAEMMLVDGCFILEYLCRLHLDRIGYTTGIITTADPILQNDLICNTIQGDLLLLENQIPFLVLERLFPLTLAQIPNLPPPLEKLSLMDYVEVLQFPLLDYMMRLDEGNSTNSDGSVKTSCLPRDCVLWVWSNKMDNPKLKQEVSSKDEEKVSSPSTEEEDVSSGNAKRYHHILHKLHDDFLPRDRTGEMFKFMPSASELVYAGVKFVWSSKNDIFNASSTAENDPFNVEFTEPKGPFWWCRSARFQIPLINIFNHTESFLRNLIAFEQNCCGIEPLFTSYAILMDMLVKSDTDVQELKKAGVLRSWKGASEDVTHLFNKLLKENIMGWFFFADACNRATKYSKHFWPKNMAYLRRQYFASPWRFIAFCLAFVAFGVTIGQLIVGIVK